MDPIGNEDGASNADDGKWRPNVLIMMILYKVTLIFGRIDYLGMDIIYQISS